MKYVSCVLLVALLLCSCVLPVQALEPDTVYDMDGSVVYSADGEAEDGSLFLQKPFEEYTVQEGFCLLFLLLLFCWTVWKIIKGVL